MVMPIQMRNVQRRHGPAAFSRECSNMVITPYLEMFFSTTASGEGSLPR
jgi:hypothetical protein